MKNEASDIRFTGVDMTQMFVREALQLAGEEATMQSLYGMGKEGDKVLKAWMRKIRSVRRN